MKKTIKYMLVLLLIGLVGYKSVYFRKLSEVQKMAGENFDAVSYSQKIWKDRLPARLDSAVELTSLIKWIETNPTDAFAKYSNAMGIGNYRYSMVKVNGVAAVINEDDIAMQFSHSDSLMTIKLATEYVYGNAIRDASRLLDIKHFNSTSDLNRISEELNKTVRTTVLPAFKNQVKKGEKIEVTGAVEFNMEHINFKDLELLPVRIRILQ
jgi:predicted lipoprotein